MAGVSGCVKAKGVSWKGPDSVACCSCELRPQSIAHVCGDSSTA